MRAGNKKGGPSAHPYLDLITILGFAGNIGFFRGEARGCSGVIGTSEAASARGRALESSIKRRYPTPNQHNPGRINMLRPDGSQATIEEAQAYFARRSRIRFWGIGLRLLPPLLPLLYAGGAILASRDLSGGWFAAWAEALSGVSAGLSRVLPGLDMAAAQLYPDQRAAQDVFLNFATVDVACVVVSCIVALRLLSRLRIEPPSDSPESSFLQDVGKGFPVSYGMNPARVGGRLGGLVFAICVVLLGPALLYVVYVSPLRHGGGILTDAHLRCVAHDSAFWFVDRYSHCIRFTENTLAGTVWKLSWMSSLAAIAIPATFLIIALSLIYPIWTIHRVGRGQ